MTLSQTIGFIGAGQMARALASGFVKSGLIQPERIMASDPLAPALKAFQKAVPGARATSDNASVAAGADVVFLATKPQQLAAAMTQLRAAAAGKLVVSIAAGVTLKTLADALGESRLVRVMPNTPCLIAQSASGYCLGPRATSADGQLVAQLLSAVGRAFPLDEKLLDAAIRQGMFQHLLENLCGKGANIGAH